MVTGKERRLIYGMAAIVLGAGAFLALMPRPSAPAAAAPATGVPATLKDFSVDVPPASVPAGEVRFTVTNQGGVPHEFVILKTENPANALPYDTAKQQAVEDGSGDKDVGEIEDIDPGQTKADTFTLEAGRYVLICNLPGHYKLGMYASFTVGNVPAGAPITAAPATQPTAVQPAVLPALPKTGTGSADRGATLTTPEVLGILGGGVFLLGLALFSIIRLRRSA